MNISAYRYVDQSRDVRVWLSIVCDEKSDEHFQTKNKEGGSKKKKLAVLFKLSNYKGRKEKGDELDRWGTGKVQSAVCV